MKKILSVLCLAIALVSFNSCNKSDSPESKDYGTAVSGTYTGKLTAGTVVVEDAYVVYIKRISSTVVSMTADFLDGSANFNVEKSGDNFILSSETVYNITTTVANKSLYVTYKSQSGNLISFTGQKD